MVSKLEALLNSCLPNSIIHYKGVSKCRICNCFNGSREYYIDNFFIPEGYLHYLKVHNVGIDERLRKYLLYKIVPFEPTKIGYWREKDITEEMKQANEQFQLISETPNSILKVPIENTATDDHAILIEKLQQLLNTNKAKNGKVDYFGFSTCRICEDPNGCSEYKFDNLIIPSGYLHYLTHHNVGMDERLRNYLLYGTIPTETAYIGYWIPMETIKKQTIQNITYQDILQELKQPQPITPKQTKFPIPTQNYYKPTEDTLQQLYKQREKDETNIQYTKTILHNNGYDTNYKEFACCS